MPILVLVKCFWKAALEEKLFPLKDSAVYGCLSGWVGGRGGVWGWEGDALYSTEPDYQTFFFFTIAHVGLQNGCFS